MRNKANSAHSRHHGTETHGSLCHTESAPHPSADDLLIHTQGDTEVEAPRDLDERLRNLKS